MDRYKVRLVAKGYTQTYDIDYFETFLSVIMINSIRILFFIAVNLLWPLFQLDVKNAFLYIMIFRRKCIWSNLHVMLLRGRKSAIKRRLYMDSSRVQGRSLRSPVLSFLVLAFADVIHITLSLFSAQGLAL